MRAIFETLFDIFYLLTVLSVGIRMIRNSKGSAQFQLFGWMAVVLGAGDSFHLVPRALALCTTGLDSYAFQLGLGKWITSVTMTVFYVLLYYVWRQRYHIQGQKAVTWAVYALSAARVILCMMPQNQWLTNHSPLSWGIYRNLPFALLGLLVIGRSVQGFYKLVHKPDAKTEQPAEEQGSKGNVGTYALLVLAGIIHGLFVSGGPLLTGLLVGHFGHIGPISLETKKSTMETLRELGLAWFLLGAGTEAGQGFVEVVKEQGFVLFIYGALMTLIPMLAVFLIAKKLMKMGTMNTLGSICGGMTSTPALGSLIAVAGSDAVAAAYAATYPIALVCVVLSSQFVALLL